MKNVAEQIRKQIEELQTKKSGELETVAIKQNEARIRIEAAKEAEWKAADEMNLEAYEEARAEKRKAQSVMDMYGAKYRQIEKQEYISEMESDKVIQSLLDYEEALTKEFHDKASAPLKALRELVEQYKTSISETEQTIRDWTGQIHANYIDEGCTRTLPNGSETHRMEKPVPVHRIEYTGSKESAQITQFFKILDNPNMITL